jgi:hypothetical protein
MGDYKLKAAAQDVRKLVCLDSGVLEVGYGSRFDEDVISVVTVSKDDRERLLSILPSQFENFRVHISGPFYGIGGLMPDSPDTKRYRFWSQSPPYNVVGSPENRELDSLIEFLVTRDRDIWRSWDVAHKNSFIATWITKKREVDPEFANCGDKFLTSDG